MLRDDLHPAPLPADDEQGDTKGYIDSYDEANAGPRPGYVNRPQGQQGGRRPVTQSELDELLALPFRMGDMAAEIRELRGVVRLAMAPISWSNCPASSNVTATAHPTAGGYLQVCPPLVDGTFVELRNLAIGSDTTGVLQLIASPNDKLYSDGLAQRILTVVRLTVNVQTVFINQRLSLRPRESLFLYHTTSATAALDFSGEYRGMRSE